MDITGVNLNVTGIVQGVGFRPFVYNLAEKLMLGGWVRNTSAGVEIYLEGQSNAIEDFLFAINHTPPPLSKIENITVKYCQSQGLSNFQIIHSEPIPNAFQPISPDVCICEDCLHELFDPFDRRYHYPFINCTNCGPRFTIIKDIPYDRPMTTMAGFEMCPACQREYLNHLDRRFHAQPVACPDCGPQVWLENGAENLIYKKDEAIVYARKMLYDGKILAIKGLGGFHLACDATNRFAVIELRKRKLRVDKPFALMLPDLRTVERHCFIDEHSRKLLSSHQRPIVILSRRPESSIAREVAPEQDKIGIMLPYTPLHYLLFANEAIRSEHLEFDDLCLVMTSGNLSEEPIAIDNDEARQRLGSLADAFLFHDRPIHIRCDDSVVRVNLSGDIYPLRRSRGYAPVPVYLPHTTPPLLATGSELKNTFCLARDNYAFPSHHIGDMENLETFQSFVDGIDHMQRLFRIQPTILACDLHPDYLATRYAHERAQCEGLVITHVQHHHAHIAACMAENGLTGDERVLGIAFDGTGYGQDGMTWGGEFLIADYRGFTRAFHLRYFPLPGGDKGTRKPARIALAYLWQSGLTWQEELPCAQALCADERKVLYSQLEHKINTPLTSSMGRLFDAIASLAGVKHQVNYEAQAAIELEALVDPTETKSYPFEAVPYNDTHPGLLDPTPTITAVRTDVLSNIPVPIISARFHNTIAEMVIHTARTVRSLTGINKIVLSGGVWQNMTLLNKSLIMLKKDRFIVYTHHQVPTNDGGISLGQAVVAAYQAAR
ncbi:MAG: carbamoyltransferase HypF [Chloroflexi bacterium RBG_19FT_COMBO_47_9]|nr:MAG: carbamoyltransferase HypF [Chloroflexi bacterium RBG_19FT_COMBO_47_9]